MPSKSPAQHRLMEAAAHTPGGYDGVPQKVGKEFVAHDEGEGQAFQGDDANVVTETDIAKGIRDGLLESPQRVGDIWFFDLRITGTGISYRPSVREYVFRPPEYYLNDEFLERCQGLPVIFDHPEKKDALDTEEYRQRSIGAIVLPYIPDAEDDFHSPSEVWGIARIYDDDAAQLMLTSFRSTSPHAGFDAESSTKEVRTEDGDKLLIEGKPRFIDHVAVCDVGVWDKGGTPRGIATGKRVTK